MKGENMLGETGTEQFTIETKQDGKLIRAQAIHDPFLYNKTTIAISRWDLFKALFRKQFVTTIEVSVRGTEGVQRAIMMLDPKQLEAESAAMMVPPIATKAINASAEFPVAERER